MSCFICDISCIVAAIEISESFKKNNAKLNDELSRLNEYAKNNFNIDLNFGTTKNVREKMAKILTLVNCDSYNERYPDEPKVNYYNYIPDEFRQEFYDSFIKSKVYIGIEYRFAFDERKFLQALKWLECYSYNCSYTTKYSDFVKIIDDIVMCMKDIFIYNNINYASSKWGCC